MRKPIIAGNWKMNNNMEESLKFVEELKKESLSERVEAVLCVPFLNLKPTKDALEGTDIKVGAQNMHFEESGAYTGEVSAAMLTEIDIDYVIIGHSERRQYFNETDETVNKKIHTALKHKLKPILCVGESLEEREAGKEKDIVKKQVIKGLANVAGEEIENLVIAYEPIWAIGTGKTASSDDANDMCKHIREVVAEEYGKEAGDIIRIQYGGSVKPENVKELMSKSDIDGALVGGASLKVDSFTSLVNY